jgi:hypothetical protein
MDSAFIGSAQQAAAVAALQRMLISVRLTRLQQLLLLFCFLHSAKQHQLLQSR